MFKNTIGIPSSPSLFQRDQTPKLLFLITLAGYPLIQLFVQPRWLLSGGVWAEAGTNYFVKANSTNLLVQLFSTDSGYIPLPQRIIALIANWLNFPAASIPYFYNWAALFISALLVAIFCLKPFRILIQSDYSRFLFCVLILAFSEWAVRTFINFTYYGLFFSAIIGSLIFASQKQQNLLPWYIWLTPLLILSKPAIIATVPFLVFASLRNSPNLKSKIFLMLVFFVTIIQIIQLVISRLQGVFDRGVQFNYKEQIPDFFLYLVSIPGSIVLGIEPSKNYLLVAAIGGLILAISIYVIWKKEYGFEVVISGLSLFVCSLMFNAITVFDHWNSKTWSITAVPVTSHSLGPYIGGLIACFGILNWLYSKLDELIFSKIFQTITFLIAVGWFMLSGWFTYLTAQAQQPSWPLTGNGNWVQSSSLIDSGNIPICVPIDPNGWVYGVECRGLNTPGWDVAEEQLFNQNSEISILEPSEISGATIMALEIPVKSSTGLQTYTNLKVSFTLKNGIKVNYVGSGIVDNSPHGLTLTGKSIDFKDIENVELSSDVPIKVIGKTSPAKFMPSILWMGK